MSIKWLVVTPQGEAYICNEGAINSARDNTPCANPEMMELINAALQGALQGNPLDGWKVVPLTSDSAQQTLNNDPQSVNSAAYDDFSSTMDDFGTGNKDDAFDLLQNLNTSDDAVFQGSNNILDTSAQTDFDGSNGGFGGFQGGLQDTTGSANTSHISPSLGFTGGASNHNANARPSSSPGFNSMTNANVSSFVGRNTNGGRPNSSIGFGSNTNAVGLSFGGDNNNGPRQPLGNHGAPYTNTAAFVGGNNNGPRQPLGNHATPNTNTGASPGGHNNGPRQPLGNHATPNTNTGTSPSGNNNGPRQPLGNCGTSNTSTGASLGSNNHNSKGPSASQGNNGGSINKSVSTMAEADAHRAKRQKVAAEHNSVDTLEPQGETKEQKNKKRLLGNLAELQEEIAEWKLCRVILERIDNYLNEPLTPTISGVWDRVMAAHGLTMEEVLNAQRLIAKLVIHDPKVYKSTFSFKPPHKQLMSRMTISPAQFKKVLTFLAIKKRQAGSRSRNLNEQALALDVGTSKALNEDDLSDGRFSEHGLEPSPLPSSEGKSESVDSEEEFDQDNELGTIEKKNRTSDFEQYRGVGSRLARPEDDNFVVSDDTEIDAEVEDDEEDDNIDVDHDDDDDDDDINSLILSDVDELDEDEEEEDEEFQDSESE